jgi:hypothetical protein
MMVSDSLFKADLEALYRKAYGPIVQTAMYPRWGFKQYWEFVTKTLEEDRKRTQSDFYTEMYKEYTSQDWIKAFERWLNARTDEERENALRETGASNEESASEPNDDFLTALNSKMNDAIFKESENRADLIIDFLQDKAQEFTDAFGMDGTELIYSILSGLKKEEAQRLGGPKPVTATAEVLEKTDEEVIDELDFLDDDIDEVFNLEELEEELDLDDLNLD